MKVLYGSQNFGYAVKGSDKDYMQFVYPTWEDILKNNVISKEVKNGDGSVTKVKDIRLIPKMIEKGNFNDLQFLYSKEVTNDDEFRWLFENRDRLVKANKLSCFRSNKGYIISCLKSGTRKDMVRALCFSELINRVLALGEFNLEVKGLSKYREDESLEISADKIKGDLDYFEYIAEKWGKDTEILDELNCFILKLLKSKLNKG